MKNSLLSFLSRAFKKQKQSELGFALIEMVVALVIMALVGLMAWRGMDAMIRGREVIDKRANQDSDYSQLVSQFERDCQSLLSKDEIASLASTVTGSAMNSPLAAGAKNIWFLRRYRGDNVDAWLIAGYVVGPLGLQRWTSRPLLQRNDAGVLWSSIARDPDLSSSDLLVSLDIPSIVRQSFQMQTSMVNGAGGTGSPGSAAAGANPAIGTTSITADQQGVMMQWWVQGVTLPITRSCLTGSAL